MMASNTKIIFNDNMKLKPNSKNKDYTCFSNYYICSITIDEKEYNSVESFYHSSKYIKTNPKAAERIRGLFSPGLCKKVLNEFILTEDEQNNWNRIHILVMKRALFTKFITNNELAKTLISTEDSKLIYNKTEDEYWGSGADNRGQNLLGRLLEEVRDVLTDLPNVDDEDTNEN